MMRFATSHTFFKASTCILGLCFLWFACAIDAQASTADTTDAGATLAEAPISAEVTGFRSAVFGMDEASVLEAIRADFGREGDQIAAGENNIERTRVVTISVPDVLEGGGIARVSYVFGYESKGLIQVGVSWSAESDPELTDVRLVANGDVLRSYFLAAGYVPDSITVNSPLDTGILLFRGMDVEGRSSILLLQGEFEDVGTGQQTLLPNSLALLYSLNPDNPDVFRVKKGSF